MFSTRSVHLKELMVQKWTRVWKFGSFPCKIRVKSSETSSSDSRPREGSHLQPKTETLSLDTNSHKTRNTAVIFARSPAQEKERPTDRVWNHQRERGVYRCLVSSTDPVTLERKRTWSRKIGETIRLRQSQGSGSA